MHRSILISSLLLAASRSALAAVHVVDVGGPGVLAFNPPSVEAAVGDTVTFRFLQKNHTVTQSTLAAPCVYIPHGFDSGFQFVPDDKTQDFNIANLQVKTTDPIWAFCRQGNHCQQGMVFAVNPGDKLAVFQENAKTNPFGTSTASAPAGTVVATATDTVTTTSAPASTASPALTTDHRIIVGGPNTLTFSPANITAAVGDTITFEFRQKNHTVTASAFNTPCQPLSSTSTTGEAGFDSGFMPVAEGVTSGFPTYTITVNSTAPIWAYCKQGNHCGQGMVFAANAVESGPKNFSAFQDLAKKQNGTTTTTPPPASGAVPVRSGAWALAAALGAAALFV